MTRRPRVKEYTAEQCLYYVALTDYPTYNNPRSVSDASRFLGKKGHSTVSSAVNQRFLPEEMVRPVLTPKIFGEKQTTVYAPGLNAKFIEREIERYVSAFKDAKIVSDGENEAPVEGQYAGCERCEPSLLEMLRWCCGENVSLPNLNKYRYHINGSGFIFDVVEEGCIPFLDIPTPQGIMQESLFGGAQPSYPNGCIQYDTLYSVRRGQTDFYRYNLRYQRFFKSNTRIFSVHPPMIVSPFMEGWTEKDIIQEFLRITYPLLERLEKYGGWKFRRLSNGVFAFHLKAGEEGDGSRPGKGVKLEVGFDGDVTAMVREKLGKFGTPGETQTWVDESLKALGDGELETNNISYVEGWEKLPETTRLARENRIIQLDQEAQLKAQGLRMDILESASDVLDERQDRMDKRQESIDERQQDMSDRLDRLEARYDRTYELIGKLARNQESSARNQESMARSLVNLDGIVSRLTGNVIRTAEAVERLTELKDGDSGFHDAQT